MNTDIQQVCLAVSPLDDRMNWDPDFTARNAILAQLGTLPDLDASGWPNIVTLNQWLALTCRCALLVMMPLPPWVVITKKRWPGAGAHARG
ncbi:hypothetical protein MBH78_21805 [Oceanimonas sp. NS1]|nr:hypothetical protein [Oceanimonas sp. NS1]